MNNSCKIDLYNLFLKHREELSRRFSPCVIMAFAIVESADNVFKVEARNPENGDLKYCTVIVKNDGMKIEDRLGW